MPSKDEPLQGYRLVLYPNNAYTEEYYQGNGASILKLSEAPQTERDKFTKWWRLEVSRARRDRVVLVVLKTYDESPRRNWLETIEEEEWYSNNDGWPGRVRFVTTSKLSRAISRRELPTDDWGEAIENRFAARSDSESDSEAEFDG